MGGGERGRRVSLAVALLRLSPPCARSCALALTRGARKADGDAAVVRGSLAVGRTPAAAAAVVAVESASTCFAGESAARSAWQQQDQHGSSSSIASTSMGRRMIRRRKGRRCSRAASASMGEERGSKEGVETGCMQDGAGRRGRREGQELPDGGRVCLGHLLAYCARLVVSMKATAKLWRTQVVSKLTRRRDSSYRRGGNFGLGWVPARIWRSMAGLRQC